MGISVSAPFNTQLPADLVLLSGNELLVQLFHHYIEQQPALTLRVGGALQPSSSSLWLLDVQSFADDELPRVFADLYGKGPVALVNVTQEQAEPLVEQYPWINGVFVSSCPREQFLRGVDTLLHGGDWLPRGLTEQLLRQLRRLHQPAEIKVRLTSREREILELVRKGLPNSQIAEHLCLSPHTIKSHVHNLLRKVGATNRGEAAFLVLGGGLA